ncbi:MAG: hypothetical protein ACFFDV_08955, partial [Candidatus Thorarchaeota archaeon]
MSKTGWLLDANVDYEREALTLWIKTEGKTKGYIYRGFKPSVFVSTDMIRSRDWTEADILRAVLEHPKAVDALIVHRFTSVYDEEKTPVLKVFTTPDALQDVAKDLEQLPGATVFHADIDPVQQFFIANELFAFGRVEFEAKGDEVVSIRGLDRREDPEYDIPELKIVDFEVVIATEQIFPKMEDRIQHIEVYGGEGTVHIENEDEGEIIRRFQEVIDEIDPDVIISRGGDDNLFRYLSIRSKVNGLQLRMSRDGTPLNVVYREPQSFWQYNR